MAVTASVLIQGKSAEDAQTTQYTSTAAVTIIDKFTATNYGAVAATLSVNLVQSGAAAAAQNLVAVAKSLQPSETYTFPEVAGHVLSSGGFLSTLASAPLTIGIRASGRIIT